MILEARGFQRRQLRRVRWTSASIRTAWCTSSAPSNKPVQDLREVVKAGDVVKVKVLEVDAARKRIALTMRLDDEPAAQKHKMPFETAAANGRFYRKPQRNDRAPANSAMADAFAKLEAVK